MKVSRRQLIKIINENLMLEAAPLLIVAGIGAYGVAGWLFGKTYKMRVAGRSENEIYTNMAKELERAADLGTYEKMFEDLAMHAVNCNDEGLIEEIRQYVDAGKTLAALIGLDWDASDTLGVGADILAQGASQSLAPTTAVAALTLSKSKDALKTVSKTGKSILGPIIGFLFAGFDVYDAETAAAEVKKKVNVDKLNDDLMGFMNLHDQIKKGQLPCKPLK